MTIPSLSKRGNALAANPARIDIEIFMEAMQNLFCPDTNPDGAFPLNVAENQLMTSEIKARLSLILQESEVPDWVLNYTDLLGNTDVRVAIAKFMERYLCKCPIPEDTIGLSAGASAIIETSSFVLANPGDVVVIPAPSYPMYTNDLGIKSGIERYDLQTHYHLGELGAKAPVTTTLLEGVLRELQEQGKCFKILLITSPDNPTGCRYTEKELRTLARWCVEHEIHMIVNEIYGLSLIDTEDEFLKADYPSASSFVSFAKIMQELASNYLHLWYAFSKDFAMSGLRVGVVHSLNENFIRGFANVNVPHLVSNLTQWALAELVKDTNFIDSYVLKNKKRITQSYALVVKHFRTHKIPYIPSRGSFFVWVDFSEYLVEDTTSEQEKLWLEIYKNTGVLLTPGEGFGHQKKGLFRLVFTAVPLGHLKVAMDRMMMYLRHRKRT